MHGQLEDFTVKIHIMSIVSFLTKIFGFFYILDFFGFVKPLVNALELLYP